MLGLTTLLCVALALGPTPEAQPNAYADTQRAFDAGLAAYDSGAHGQALAKFDEAVTAAAVIEDEALRAEVLAAIALNRGLTRLARHASKHDDAELELAKRELDAAIAAAPAQSDTRPRLVDLRATVIERLAASRSAAPPKRPLRERKATVAGIAVGASSGIALAVMIAGLALGPGAEDDFNAGPTRADRDAADERGTVANSMAFAGGLSAAILASVAVGLIILGERRDVHEKKTARRRWGSGGGLVRFAP